MVSVYHLNLINTYYKLSKAQTMIYSKWRWVDTDVIEKEHFVVLNTKLF